MVPTVELPPVTPLTCQVTAVLVVLVTEAVNCWVPPSCTFAVAGDTATLGGAGGVLLPPQPNKVDIRRSARTVKSDFFITGPHSGKEALNNLPQGLKPY